MISNKLENGLKEMHQKILVAILVSNPRVESAWLFGSRAINTFKPNSDIDLVLEGKLLGLSDVADILEQIELTSIPYKVDILIKHKIKNEKLVEHIDNYGVRWV